MKIFESEKTLAFLDIGPLSKGHSVSVLPADLTLEGNRGDEDVANSLTQLIIPKHHGAKLHDIPDDQLAEVLSVTKRIAIAQGVQDYNILQNNGRIAHQEVDHVSGYRSGRGKWQVRLTNLGAFPFNPEA